LHESDPITHKTKKASVFKNKHLKRLLI